MAIHTNHLRTSRAHHQMKNNNSREKISTQEESKLSHWHDQGSQLKEQRRVGRNQHLGHKYNNFGDKESFEENKFNQTIIFN